MIPIPPTIAIIAAGAILSGVLGVWGGYTLSAKHFEPKVEKLTVEITTLRTKIELADQQAKAEQLRNEENANEIKIKLDAASIAIADSERVRNAMQARIKAYTAIVAAQNSPGRTIPTPSQSGLLEPDIEFGTRCATDASRVKMCSAFLVKEGYKPAQ